MENFGVELIAPDVAAAADVLEYGSDPEFCRFIVAQPMQTVDQAEAFIRTLVDANARGERLYFMVRVDGKIVGTLGFIFGAFPDRSVFEIGYGISRAVWGQGVFRRSIELLAPLAASMQATKLVARFTEKNLRNARALEKCGFVRETAEPGLLQYGLSVRE